MYLANRGIKCANVPVVPGCPMPEELLRARGPLIVGLTKDPASLVQVRQNRLRMLTDDKQETDYVNLEAVRQEIAQRSEEHTSELQSLMRISYAVFCLKKK